MINEENNLSQWKNCRSCWWFCTKSKKQSQIKKCCWSSCPKFSK